jgi:DNA-binding beta-propeller fold protein YncE
MMRLVLLVLFGASVVNAAEPPVLELEAKIPLGNVRGRIDHLAIDASRQRLFVAELGNDTVGVVDLGQRRTIRQITGLKEPQGIGYVASTDTVYIANAGDGTVYLFQGESLAPAGQLALGADADNVRVDDGSHRVFVGYGSGAIAVLDSLSGRKLSDIALKAHPESFQLDSGVHRLFVNVPDAHEIAVVDGTAARQVVAWTTGTLRANFPMALDRSRNRAIVVFRNPAKVAAFDTTSGRIVSETDTCGDSDDVFVDAKRSRVYVSCGEGFIDVLTVHGDSYVRLSRIPTAVGARTSLFAPEVDRLMLAVRETGSHPAAIWVYRPMGDEVAGTSAIRGP